MCIPMEPQGILLAEISYEDPKTELRRPKLTRNRKLFIGNKRGVDIIEFLDGYIYISVAIVIRFVAIFCWLRALCIFKIGYSLVRC